MHNIIYVIKIGAANAFHIIYYVYYLWSGPGDDVFAVASSRVPFDKCPRKMGSAGRL